VAKDLLAKLALAGGAVAAIAVATSTVEPVYVGRQPVVQRLVEQTWRDSVAERAPWAVAEADSALQSDRFEADRRAFASDLLRTGQVDAARADTLATFAVREAYKRRVPPALVFGVMLTENSTLKSHARSNVGAQGLMQVYGKVWVPTLGKYFGRNLRDDETNLRYGVHILSHYVYRAATRTEDADSAFRVAMLRYNGCVKGTNTKGCHSYPDKVRRKVESFAVAQCGSAGYEGCVSEPLRLTLAMNETAPKLTSE
jgi:soluble lytic murein transglycosylase-like protein